MPVEDIYMHNVDFTSLALKYPAFSKKLKANRQLDFSDPESVLQLTKALLHRDFDLTLDLPPDRLCPPVPNRFNYILFAQRLTDSTRLDHKDDNSPTQTAIGIDIGTGASAIYPLLACRQRATWAFLTTEIDAKSRSYAEHNINTNNLQSRIRILDADGSGQRLIPTADLQRFDDYAIRIQITNPPFYASETEMRQSAKEKSRPPNSACTGAPIEMIVEGGEVSFVSRLIQESALPLNRTKIQWFSSMLGKLSSVSSVVEGLREAECTNYAVTEFIQGQRTRRWCVAWSWFSIRPPSTIARGISSMDKKLLPFPTDFGFDVAQQDTTTVSGQINQEMSRLNMRWDWSDKTHTGIGRSVEGDVWSRKARRKRQQHDHEMKDVDAQSVVSSEDEPEPTLAFRVSLQQAALGKDNARSVSVLVRWLQGHDHVLFESFCGWLKRKLQSS